MLDCGCAAPHCVARSPCAVSCHSALSRAPSPCLARLLARGSALALGYEPLNQPRVARASSPRGTHARTHRPRRFPSRVVAPLSGAARLVPNPLDRLVADVVQLRRRRVEPAAQALRPRRPRALDADARRHVPARPQAHQGSHCGGLVRALESDRPARARDRRRGRDRAAVGRGGGCPPRRQDVGHDHLGADARAGGQGRARAAERSHRVRLVRARAPSPRLALAVCRARAPCSGRLRPTRARTCTHMRPRTSALLHTG